MVVTLSLHLVFTLNHVIITFWGFKIYSFNPQKPADLSIIKHFNFKNTTSPDSKARYLKDSIKKLARKCYIAIILKIKMKQMRGIFFKEPSQPEHTLQNLIKPIKQGMEKNCGKNIWFGVYGL